eukprot:5155997-Prymnesium_polylepis.1
MPMGRKSTASYATPISSRPAKMVKNAPLPAAGSDDEKVDVRDGRATALGDRAGNCHAKVGSAANGVNRATAIAFESRQRTDRHKYVGEKVGGRQRVVLSDGQRERRVRLKRHLERTERVPRPVVGEQAVRDRDDQQRACRQHCAGRRVARLLTDESDRIGQKLIYGGIGRRRGLCAAHILVSFVNGIGDELVDGRLLLGRLLLGRLLLGRTRRHTSTSTGQSFGLRTASHSGLANLRATWRATCSCGNT